MINLKNLETLISEMDFGENIKVLSFDKIQVKRKDKSIANICSSFRTKEEYKCLVKEIVSPTPQGRKPRLFKSWEKCSI